MKSFLTVLFTLFLIFMISCAAGKLKKEEIDPWLNTISGGEPQAMDITGKWHDPNGNFMFGWGEGYLRQEQNKVSGAIGNYNVKGIVSGKQAYLVFFYGGSVYYTARLEMFDEDFLTGNYFGAGDKNQANGYPTSLARTKKRGIIDRRSCGNVWSSTGTSRRSIRNSRAMSDVRHFGGLGNRDIMEA